jgi:SAM-dependent methyltransferase
MRGLVRLTGRSWLQERHLLPAMARHGKASNGRVLDLGCGLSPWRRFFPYASAFIRMDRYAADTDVIVINDIYRLPLEDCTVDTVLLSRMLGDIPDQRGLMAELARVLSPGGRILIYEAISYPQHDLPHDYWRVLPAGLRWAAESANLEVEELIYCGGYGTQLAVQLNSFVIGDLGGFWFTRPIAACLRAATNLSCAAIDALKRRPSLATDYFASIVKKPPRNLVV